MRRLAGCDEDATSPVSMGRWADYELRLTNILVVMGWLILSFRFPFH